MQASGGAGVLWRKDFDSSAFFFCRVFKKASPNGKVSDSCESLCMCLFLCVCVCLRACV